MSELLKPIEATYNQMMVKGESGGHITRFVPEQCYLKDFATVQEEYKNLFNSFRDVDEANAYIGAMKRDLERISNILQDLQDTCTELRLHFESECIEKAHAEHF